MKQKEENAMDKLTFERQMIAGVAFLLLMQVCAYVFRRGIFINIGWVMYGLAFILHPVCPQKSAGVKNARLWVRIGGLVCLLVGALTRFAM